MEATMSNVFRVVFLGGPEVGKTAIIQRCVHGKFKEKYAPTVEDMYFYKLTLPGKDGIPFNFHYKMVRVFII
jgi:GTPase SAR1 family protein